MDLNNPFTVFDISSDFKDEGHPERADQSMKSNIKGAEHPIYSANGLIQTINFSRNLSNSTEKELTGKIPNKVFKDVTDASRKNKMVPDILLFILDWEKDMTSRQDASDAQSTAQKIIGKVTELRSTLGRDPMNAEVFMAHVLGSASKVKQLIDLAEQKPDEEAKPQGTKKDNIIMNKQRNGKDKKRTNFELLNYFWKRAGPSAKVTFKQYLGKVK